MERSMALLCWTFSLLCLSLHFSPGLTAGSGRAFPAASENYVISRFENINPKLEWDPTNYLVDLSGYHASCKALDGPPGRVDVDTFTPEGESIAGVVDFTPGARADVDAVNEYITTIIDKWINKNMHVDQIRTARKFGCSVRPACTGNTVVSCLFSPRYSGEIGNIELPIHNPPGEQTAVAFTAEQYKVAERITGRNWDQSHFLENLSGFETDCAMMDNPDWPYAFARQKALDHGLEVTGMHGYEPNNGDTQTALEGVLRHFKQMKLAKTVGCSLIPDCMEGPKMYVVVSCLYEEF